MGTNFYLHREDRARCEHCGRSDKLEPLHIGKSSAGWCFALRIHPALGIYDLPDWEREWALPGTWIENEYGDRIAVSNLRTTITERSYPRGERGEGQPGSGVRGPNGLRRHRVDGRYCHGRGSGTWDLIDAEFS